MPVVQVLPKENYDVFVYFVDGNTLAWTLDGKYDKNTCIDIDPYTIYEKGIDVKDPLEQIA